MTRNSIILALTFAVLLTSVTLVVYHKQFSTKIAYVDIKKLFNGFDMKSELEKEYMKTQRERDKLLDSLSTNLKILSKHLNMRKQEGKNPDTEELTQFSRNREEFLALKARFEEDNAVLSRKYDERILDQLTQYVIEFGETNNYDIILGADGTGNLMYSKSRYDISKEVMEFINKKYKGNE